MEVFMHPSSKILLVVLTLFASQVSAQDAASRASTASLESLSVLPSASLELLAAGAAFSVVATRPLGHGLEVVLRSAEASVEITIQITAATAQVAALAIGTGIDVSATTGGFLLSAAGEVIAFVPDAVLATMIYREELRR